MSVDIDPILWALVLSAIFIMIVAVFMRIFKQPYVISYMLVGLLLGPHVLGVFKDQAVLQIFGEIGIILLLFFIGMHTSLPKLISNWRIPIIGTLLQVVFSLLFTYVLGFFFGWTAETIILMGFVISLSCTAIVIKILQEWNEIDTRVGQNVLGILIVQDLVAIPMLIVLSLMSGEGFSPFLLTKQIVGAVLIVGALVWVLRKKKIEIKYKFISNDKELQVFLALALCFGLALISNLFGLSFALGAFVAGSLVSLLREDKWVQSSLEPVHVIFVTLFFIYVGSLLDPWFVLKHIFLILFLVLGALIANTLINAIILRLLGSKWNESLYAGALLAQIGEFSFLLVAIGLSGGIISEYTYNLALSVIAISLFLSPGWIVLAKKVLGINRHYVFELVTMSRILKREMKRDIQSWSRGKF